MCIIEAVDNFSQYLLPQNSLYFLLLSISCSSPLLSSLLISSSLSPPYLFSSLYFNYFDFLTCGTGSNAINRLGLPPQIKHYFSCYRTPGLRFIIQKYFGNEKKKKNERRKNHLENIIVFVGKKLFFSNRR